MAKKKPTNQSKQETQPQPQQQQQQQQHVALSQPLTSMDDASSEKLQSLKNLNSMLLKETSYRRQQVETLIEAKQALESALNRSTMHQNLLESQLSDAADGNAVLEIQSAVVLVLLESHAREMALRIGAVVAEREEAEVAAKRSESRVAVLEGEIDRLASVLEEERLRFGSASRERDRLKRDLDGAVDAANELKEKLMEKEETEREINDELRDLRLERERLLEEVSVKERAIGEAMKERDLALRDSAESARVIDELRGEIEVVTREKGEVSKLKEAQEEKIAGLELELKRLNEYLCDSRKGEALMRAKILELEGSVGSAAEKEEAMATEIRGLVKLKEEMEGNVEALKEGRDGVQKALDEVRRELEDKRREVDEKIREKNEIELLKIERESEISELQRALDGHKDVVHKMEESFRGIQVSNKHLVSEVDHYMKSTEEAMLERDSIRKGFHEEKEKAERLALQVAAMEGKIAQMGTELEQVRSDLEKLAEENKMLESRIGSLKNEKDTLQRSLVEARRESDDLRATVEFSCNKSSQALELLKSTAALVSQTNENMEEAVSDKRQIEEELLQPYAEQLGAIKNSFRVKNKMVADMKKQLELMQGSVASANKMKSLWTVISSATTIFAAALAVYVARGY